MENGGSESEKNRAELAGRPVCRSKGDQMNRKNLNLLSNDLDAKREHCIVLNNYASDYHCSLDFFPKDLCRVVGYILITNPQTKSTPTAS